MDESMLSGSLLQKIALLKGSSSLGPIDVGFLAALASLLGNLTHHNGSPGLWDADEM
jgi:hypothetical protein